MAKVFGYWRRLAACGVVAILLQPAPAGARPLDACFVLDTTGSMSGVLEQARTQIWEIAQLLNRHSNDVALCVTAYRDRGDEYVTRKTGLDQDIDSIYLSLDALEAAGGGDQPEAVNQGLAETVMETQWRENSQRIIFLVGDAPGHDDYDEVQYPEIAHAASQREITIHGLMCSRDTALIDSFSDIARLTGGHTASLEGQMAARLTTPFDQDLLALQKRFLGLLRPAGDVDGEQARDQWQRLYSLDVDSLVARWRLLADDTESLMPPQDWLAIEPSGLSRDRALAEREQIATLIVRLSNQREEFLIVHQPEQMGQFLSLVQAMLADQ